MMLLQGKVVFVAPTKPLVNQQIQACYQFMGVSKASWHNVFIEIPSSHVRQNVCFNLAAFAYLPDHTALTCYQQTLNISWLTALTKTHCNMQRNIAWVMSALLLQTSIEELTGSCKRTDRQDLWELPYKRIFFCTPQTFRNDLDRGSCFCSESFTVNGCKPQCKHSRRFASQSHTQFRSLPILQYQLTPLHKLRQVTGHLKSRSLCALFAGMSESHGASNSVTNRGCSCTRPMSSCSQKLTCSTSKL